MDVRRGTLGPGASPMRISRRALLGLMGGAGLGLAAKGLLERDGSVLDDLETLLSGVRKLWGTNPVPQETRRARVAVGYLHRVAGYNDSPPFDPAERYPEYPYTEQVQGRPNEGYALLREALRAWQPSGFGSAKWNPLSGVVRPGDTVAIKPNLVWEPGWDKRHLGLATTHPSTLRALVDYVYKACGPNGRIVVCEGTATARAWPELVRAASLNELMEHLRRDHGVPVELIDLNEVPKDESLLIRLGGRSMLAPLADRTLFDLHNQPDSHTRLFGAGSYYIAPQPLRADVVISLAKLKVHRATGVTLAMKNLFGIIPSWDGPYGDDHLKDVPHYTDLEASGGPRTLYLENDTTWRTTVDLNQILLYADRYGRIRRERQRRYLGIVDGLLAAGRDTFDPERIPLGVLVMGDEPVSTDAVAARVMGFDPRKVRSVSWAPWVTEPYLGPSEPFAIDVRVSGAPDLSAVSDGSRIVTPELHAYPWQGRIEANDFTPPDVLRTRVVGSEMRVVLKDQSGIYFARLVSNSGDRPLASDLQLADGDHYEGEWRGALPRSHSTRGQLSLEVGDALFNVRRETVAP